MISNNLDDLNTATMLQDFQEVHTGLFDNYIELPRVGMEYLSAQQGQSSGKLYLSWGQHFQEDPSNATASHAWLDIDLANPNIQGPWWVGTELLYSVNGYMFAIPEAWAMQHSNGRALATGRFRDGGWSGMGPSLFAIAPWLDGTPPAPNSQLSTTPLLRYANTQINPTGPKMDGYKNPDEWEGGAWITTSEKSAVVFIGAKASGYEWYGFYSPNDDGLPCVDTASTGFITCYTHDGSVCPPELMQECDGRVEASRGWWSSRWDAQMIFYDPDDFADVANGSIDPSAPQLYASLDIDEHLFLPIPPVSDQADYGLGGDQRRYRLGETAYDRERNLLYVYEFMADGAKPVIHVWAVQ